MPILNINSPTFSATLAAGYTQSQLTTFVKSRFTSVGFSTPAAETTGTTDRVGYNLNLNPSKEYGQYRVIFENSLSSGTATLRLRFGVEENVSFPGFTEVQGTLVNTALTLTNTNPLLVYAIPNTQQLFGLVFMENGTSFRGFLGIAYPTLESWYDENLWAGAMLVNSTTPNNFFLPSPNPGGINTRACAMGIASFSTRNPLNNLAQIITRPFVTYSTWGIGARFDENFGISNNSGFLTNDISIKTTGVEEYWNCWTGDNGIVFRSV